MADTANDQPASPLEPGRPVVILAVLLAFTVFSTTVVLEDHPRSRTAWLWWPALVRKHGFGARIVLHAGDRRFTFTGREGALAEEGLRLLDAGNERGAFEVFRALFSADPTRTELLPTLGLLAARIGRDRDAEHYLHRYLQIHKNKDSRLHALLGIVQLRRRKYRKAARNLASAIAAMPRDAYLHCAIAAAYAGSGAADSAMAQLQIAWRLAGAGILPLLDESDFDSLRRRPDFQKLLARAKAASRGRPTPLAAIDTTTERSP